MPHTRVVLQSRLSSSRLPGKALLTLGAYPVAALAARRAARGGGDVVLATSTAPEDDAIVRAAARFDVPTFRGSLEDPLERFVGAVRDLDDDDVVVRLTADNVVPDADFVAGLTGALQEDGSGYVRVAEGYPYGLGGEAFTVRLLREADVSTGDPFDREHVTPWMRRRTGDHVWAPPELGANLMGVRCTIDTLDDYVVAEAALAAFADPVVPSWREVLTRWAEVAPPTPRRLGEPGANPIGQGSWVLGTVQLGVAYGAANTTGLPDPESARAVLRRAVDEGVTHLDTARAYGQSEARIGQALARGLSERVRVVTKLTPLDHVPEDAPARWARDAVLASTERSLRDLRTGSVSGLLVHRWVDWHRGGGAVAQTLDELRSSGVAQVVGASISTPQELFEAVADPRVGYVQLPFNVLDRRWTEPSVVQAFSSRPDLVVTARSVFLQGLLVSPEAPWPVNADMDIGAVREALVSVTAELGRTSVPDLCVAYALGHPFVTSVVLGAETPEQVAEQAAWVAAAPLTAEEIRHVRERVPGGSPVVVDPSTWRMAP
ncbi:aldo/keto reductase [Rothia sp. ARF10]|nr:aldo/keto reductase [Rothia sp. ARF10]